MLSEQEVLRRREELEKRRALKRQYRRRQLIIHSIIFAIAIILMIFTTWYSYRRGMDEQPASATGEQRLQILFLGTDEKQEASVRADTVMLLSLDTSSGETGILSIPRDTRVWIPSRQRWDRVNAAYAHGGPAMALEAVSNLIGLPVRYYVQTDFQGFQAMIDILGGVEINVAKEMKYTDHAQNLEIHLLPGLQILDGDKALQFVRYRDRLGDVALVDPSNDVYAGRVERQRQFFEALIAKTLNPASLVKLPQLLAQTFKIVNTNLPWDTILDLALSAAKFSPDKISTAVLPGNSDTINDAWYWIMDQAKAKTVIDSLILGTPPPLKLVVLNGSGRTGIAGKVADLLGDYGYNVVSRGNAEHFNFARTKILVAPEDAERVQALARYLGALVEETEVSNSEVTVIIGKDYSLEDRSVEI